MAKSNLARWLEERCQERRLSLRQAGDKTGLSHATIQSIINGRSATPDTIIKLANAFSDGGDHHRQLLEDQLLTLAGYRTERPEKAQTEAMARLLDAIQDFDEPQLRVMSELARFLSGVEGKVGHERK